MIHSQACAGLLVALSPLAAQDTQQAPTPATPESVGEDESNQDLWSREQLAGNAYGLRSALADVGLSLEIYYTFEGSRVLDGGIQRRTMALGNVDVLLEADLETLVGWTGARMFVYGLGNHGDKPSESLGDAQATSNIEAPSTFRLYEAWIEQSWEDDGVSGLVGLYDLNGEFDVIPSAGLFLHSSQGIGPEYASSGLNGPSIFPSTSLAARLEVRPSASSYVRILAADGVPGDPDHPRRTSIRLGGQDGVLLATEFGFDFHSGDNESLTAPAQAGLQDEGTQSGVSLGKVAIGLWGYTSRFDDLSRNTASGNPASTSGSFGTYLLAEAHLTKEREDHSQGLAAFIRAGVADDRAQPVDRYLGAGLVYQGLIEGRDDDAIGLAVAAARFGAPFRSSVQSVAARWEHWEVAFEASYHAVITPWFSIQPDVQFVVHPGGDPSTDDGWIVALRGVVSF